jgi:hypothetical protein
MSSILWTLILKKQSVISLIYEMREKCIFDYDLCHFNISSMSTLKVLVDAEDHSAHGILIWCDIGAKPVERSKLEWLI